MPAIENTIPTLVLTLPCCLCFIVPIKQIGKVATKEVSTAVCAGTPNIIVRIGRKKNPPPPPNMVPNKPITKPAKGNKKYNNSTDE
jgi:hypothetical protein